MKPVLPLAFAVGLLLAAADAATPFFDPTVPVHATPVDAGEGGVIARGLLIRAGDGQWVVFDQDLLRPALWFASPGGKDPLTLEMMSQTSWHEPTRKSGVRQPRPAGEAVALAPELPGLAANVEALLHDPRPEFGADEPGRGGLEASGRKFLGYGVPAEGAVLSHRIGETTIREWYEADRNSLRRHLAVAGGEELAVLVAGGSFAIDAAGVAASGSLHVSSNHPGLKLETHGDRLVARLLASTHERRVTLAYSTSGAARHAPTPPVPAKPVARWSETRETKVDSSAESGPGWAIDRIGLPEDNSWKRRVRPADLAFLTSQTAAVVTFEGDVWKIDIAPGRTRWRRVAAGLGEPLSIGNAGGTLQVFTRNGLVRLLDADGDGETDFYENHSSLMVQTAGTRGYPLDMEIAPDGTTFCSIGGIVTDDRSFTNRLSAIPHAGAILSVSPDGSELEIVASRIREPFIALDPESGRMVLSDQQGHYVPSSGIFPVMPGDAFGYGGGEGRRPPLVWIPHEQDNSSASPHWLRGSAFEAWNGGLLNLSYGTGRLFLIRPDGEWPATRGAAIPLGIETGVPLLHARTHPGDGSLWLAGFRIYDSRVKALEGLARLRPTDGPVAAPMDARIFQQGVVLTFSAPIDPSSLDADRVSAKEWQYRRTSGYGSPRFKRDGSQGVDELATGGVFPSKDGKSVFVHIPDLQPTMQLELTHPFKIAAAKDAPPPVYFTAADLLPAPWVELGFDPPQLEGSVASVRATEADAEPTVGRGAEVAVRFGCTACHAVGGQAAGHSGPSWLGLFGSERKFKDGTSAIADAAYLREAILEPDKKIVEGFELGMASYAGVLSEAEIESLILYIESLK